MSLLQVRQAEGTTSTSFDHRWLLFLIPICLLFIALVFTVWYVLRRRKRQRRRRNVLRNRTLVAADQEKQREREERRLSRGNSLSSRLSRMTSLKSSNSQMKHGPRSVTTSRSGQLVEEVVANDEKRQEEHKDVIEVEVLEADTKSVEDVKEDMERPEDERVVIFTSPIHQDDDLEKVAESAGVIDEARTRVRIVEDAKPARSTLATLRDVSMVGELPSREEVVSRSASRVTRTDSQKSANEMMSSSSHGGNPFASPTASSSGGHHGFESPVSPLHSAGGEQSSGGGLIRKLSGVIRLRQPSPAGLRAPSSSVQRSDSRASRKSSTRSDYRKDGGGISPPPLVAASWTYTSKAAQWKSSSTDVSAPGAAATTATSTSEGHSEQATSSKTSKDSGNKEELSFGADESSKLSLPVTPITRRPSTGVAGSRFVESFDD